MIFHGFFPLRWPFDLVHGFTMFDDTGGDLALQGSAENIDMTSPAVWLSGTCRIRCEVRGTL
jgi:hypothetical protein